jgi:hypothetical protein
VQREQVILGEQTLKPLDRNVPHFVESREALRRFTKMSVCLSRANQIRPIGRNHFL